MSLLPPATRLFPVYASILPGARDPRFLPSFPTRRSSDLEPQVRGRTLVTDVADADLLQVPAPATQQLEQALAHLGGHTRGDRKSTRLNSSHVAISYAVFCSKKKKHRK